MALQGKFEALTKELINHVLGFQEGEENFVRSEQFVLSNLLYHHCLATNSHAVRRSMDGLAYKFMIHGQHNRAQRLKELTSKFLASPHFKDHYEMDIEWSLLSLMVRLSNNPTQVPQTDAEQCVMSKNASPASSEDLSEDQIDWAAYLLKGEPEFVLGREEPLSDWSDHDDEDAVALAAADVDASEQEFLDVDKNTDSDSGSLHDYNQKVLIIPKAVNQEVKLLEQSHRARSWLSGNTHAPYWKETRYQHESVSSHLAANVAKVCEEAKGGEISQRISEWAVMREVLWLLMHPVSSHLFHQNEKGDFVFGGKITVPSLTAGSASRILEQMCIPLKQLRDLDSFTLKYEVPEQEPPTPVTILAYAAGLRLWRRKFQDHLSVLEKIVKKQELTCTLSWLESELSPWFRILSSVYVVHQAAFSSSDFRPRNVALRLIGSLCEGVEGSGEATTRCVLLRLLLHTLRHYFCIIHNWLVTGALVDLANEFIIQRNEMVNVTDETFWREAFTISYQLGCREISHEDPMRKGLKILLPLALALSSIGKSRELLSALQVKPSQADASNRSLSLKAEFETEMTLEELLVAHVINSINTDKCDDCDGVKDSENDAVELKLRPGEVESTKTESTSPRVEPAQRARSNMSGKEDRHSRNILNMSDLLLVMDDINREDDKDWMYPDQQMDVLARRIEGIEDVPRDVSVLCFLSSSLRPLITKKQNELDTQLTEGLIQKFQLDRHCRAVRSILLMEAGDVMHEFYTHLFNKLDHGETVDSISTSLHLESCISRLYPDLAKLFFVCVEEKGSEEEAEGKDGELASEMLTAKPKNDTTTQQLLALGLPIISIHYQAPWPVNLLLTEDIMKKFNMLFRFSLSLKRATNGLERLKFRDMASWSALVGHGSTTEESDSPLQSRLHRLQLLRLWLLCFAREIHNYFANVVFLPYHQAFEQLVNSKPSFNTIITSHEKLLNKVLTMCLMGNENNVSPLQVVLNKVFWLTQQLNHLWMRDIGRVTTEELSSLESQYAQIHRFLVTLLTRLTSTRFLPHLEGLTRSLATTVPMLTHQI